MKTKKIDFFQKSSKLNFDSTKFKATERIVIQMISSFHS